MAKIETVKKDVTFKLELTLNEMATVAAALAVPSEIIKDNGRIAGIESLMLDKSKEYRLYRDTLDIVRENK